MLPLSYVFQRLSRRNFVRDRIFRHFVVCNFDDLRVSDKASSTTNLRPGMSVVVMENMSLKRSGRRQRCPLCGNTDVHYAEIPMSRPRYRCREPVLEKKARDVESLSRFQLEPVLCRELVSRKALGTLDLWRSISHLQQKTTGASTLYTTAIKAHATYPCTNDISTGGYSPCQISFQATRARGNKPQNVPTYIHTPATRSIAVHRHPADAAPISAEDPSPGR